MAPRIHRLPESVANQIAAGEVVDRPASLLKELVENALDAGALRIAITLEGGPLGRLVITDDGSGMGQEDAELCFERHATSKITDAKDLERVRTMGFRGEAIPSIASVSRFVLTTRTDADEAAHLHLRGAVGGEHRMQPVGDRSAQDAREAPARIGFDVGRRLEDRAAFAPQAEADLGPGERGADDRVGQVAHLGARALQELSPSGHVVKKIGDLDRLSLIHI